MKEWKKSFLWSNTAKNILLAGKRSLLKPFSITSKMASYVAYFSVQFSNTESNIQFRTCTMYKALFFLIIWKDTAVAFTIKTIPELKLDII